MSDQLDLLADPGRNTIGKFSADPPATSRLAAVEAYPHTGTARRRVLDAIGFAGDGGLTDEQIQTRLGMNPSTQRPRRIELQEGGWITKAERTRWTRSHRAAVVWVLTEKGRDQWVPASDDD